MAVAVVPRISFRPTANPREERTRRDGSWMSNAIRNLSIPAIAPSILTADFGRLRSQIQEAEAAGVDLIHLDVMDGHFVPNISFGPLVVQAVREATTLPLDIHLMIASPETYVDAFIDAGADLISFHAEATPHAHRVIQHIHHRDVAAGLALNPATPLAAVHELIGVLDMILLMSVNPGYGGQAFIPETLGKVERLKELIDSSDGHHPVIEVDGGVNSKTIRPAVDAGAELFVCGSSIYSDQFPVSEGVAALRSAIFR